MRSARSAFTAAAACLAAALLLAACGGSSVTFTGTAKVPTVGVPTTGTGPSGAALSSANTSTGTTTASVPISRLVGPEGINYEANPVLAPVPRQPAGATIAGVQCQSLVQLAYQANSHLQVYVYGRPEALPAGIGLVKPTSNEGKTGPIYKASTCYYWLHTLTQDGIIHVASPVHRRFTLGQLFAIWNQPLSSDQVAQARGPVTATVGGHRWHGSPKDIPLTEHATIELAVGTPVPVSEPVDWSTSGL